MYPFEGELFPSKNKKFEELIFFVPFFDAKKANLHRHIEYVNQLGYDAFTFQIWDVKKEALKGLFASSGKFGFRHVVTDQIETLLNQFPQKKIVFAFSNPAASAIEAIARRNSSDIAALVCDSGPTSQLAKSTIRLMMKDYFPKSKILGIGAGIAMAGLWSPYLHKDIEGFLKKLPDEFPVLSIRGWKDHVISPDEIDGIFENAKQVAWQKLSLPLAGHVSGLRDFPDEYESPVANFLQLHSRAFTETKPTKKKPAPSAK